MLKRLRNMYRDSTLAFKIRVSNMIILVPLMILLILSVFGMYTENMRYQSLLEAAGVASEFSLEFKEDFDYETYLVVVENKTLEESELEERIRATTWKGSPALTNIWTTCRAILTALL